jgi:hypothetical protein
MNVGPLVAASPDGNLLLSRSPACAPDESRVTEFASCGLDMMVDEMIRNPELPSMKGIKSSLAAQTNFSEYDGSTPHLVFHFIRFGGHKCIAKSIVIRPQSTNSPQNGKS